MLRNEQVIYLHCLIKCKVVLKPIHKKTRRVASGLKSHKNYQTNYDNIFIFFHPDYTVGYGVSPYQSVKNRFADYTAGQELSVDKSTESPCPEDFLSNTLIFDSKFQIIHYLEAKLQGILRTDEILTFSLNLIS